MSHEQDGYTNANTNGNVIAFPNIYDQPQLEPSQATPATNKMALECRKLNQLSGYQSYFDWEPIRKLELRTDVTHFYKNAQS